VLVVAVVVEPVELEVGLAALVAVAPLVAPRDVAL
jgi:hypothetical protein